MQHSVDHDGPTEGGDADIVLDALAEWDESYRRGEDRPTTSFGLSDPALPAKLRGRIQTQKELYAGLKLRETGVQQLGEAAASLPCFPGYETESTIGRGGMGVFYKARDVKLNRVVAIKTVAWAEHASAAQLGRFLAEAELEVDCLMKLGASLSLPARRDEAIAVYERVIPLADRLARVQNDSPSSADLRAACHNGYASILGRDRFEVAKAHYRQAISALQNAARAGFFRDAAMRDYARKDSDLRVLHNRDEFHLILRTD